MRKTFTVYGLIGMMTAIIILAVKMAGIAEKDALLFIVPLGLVLISLALFLDTFGLFCLILAWLPFSRGVLQFEIGVITLNPYVMGMLGMGAVVLGRVLTGWRYGFNRVDLMIILLCFTYLISTLFSPTLLQSGYLAFHGIFVPVISYFVVRGMITSEKQYKQALVFLLGGVTLFGLFAIFQFLATHERVSVLSMFFIDISTIAITAVLYLIYSRWWKTKVGFFSFVAAFGALLVSLSRMYLAVLLISNWLFGMLKRGKGGVLLNALLVITLVGTILVTYNAEFFRPTNYQKEMEFTTDRITSIEFLKGSIYGRALSYREGLETFFQHPFFGTGLNKGEHMVTLHNFHMEWLAYGGIIGYLFYGLLFFFHFRSASSLATTDRYCAINLLILSAILLNGVTNGFMHGMMPYVAFVVMGFNEARLRLAAQNKIEISK